MSYSDSLKLYRSTLKKARQSVSIGEQELLYPNSTKLDSHENLENICKLKSPECLEDIKNRKGKYENLVQSFNATITDYRKLVELTNFEPINSFYSEPSFEALAKINKLATLEIYIDILNNENEIALSKLKSMIELDRKFLATSHELIFDILPIVNMSERYAPLIQLLKQTGTQGLEKLLPALTSLSTNELSMNRSFESRFAFGTELLTLANIVGKNNKTVSYFNILFAKRKYKQNMTINADYEHLKWNLIPTALGKSKLLDYLELRKAQNDTALEDLMEKPIYSIDSIRNPVGELMLQIKTPKFVNIFEDKIGLDLTIILTRILVLSDSQDLNTVIKSEINFNPYKQEKAYLNSEGELCFSTSNPVCIKI